VDERAQRHWGGRLAHAMARRLKAWAKAVFWGASGAGPVVKREAPPQEEASPSIPPAGWLKDVQGLSSGAPADWVEFVQRNARTGPARMPSRVSPPRPAAAAEPPARQLTPPAPGEIRTEAMAHTPVQPPPRHESTEGAPALPGTPALPKGPFFMGEIPAAPHAEQRAVTSRAPAIETLRAFAPRAAPAPTFQELWVDRPMPHFEPREAASPVPPRREVPEQVPSSGQQVHPPASRADAHGPSEPGRRRAYSPLESRILAPITSRSQRSEDRSAAAAEPRAYSPAAYPWSEEPAVEHQRAPEQESQEDLSTLIERSWPDLTEKEERQLAQQPTEVPARPEIRWTGPWPDLPEVLPAESAEADALLRQWERLTRLDREQRGE